MKNYLLLILVFLSGVVHAVPQCINQGQVCVDAAPSKVISGQTVTLASLGETCWQYKTTYSCDLINIDTCAPLVAQGCTQNNSTCAQTDPVSGSCVLYNQSYACASSQTGQKSVGTIQTCHQVLSFTTSQSAPIPATLVKSCGTGFTITGTSCTAPATAANPNYTCASGTLSGSTCYQPAYQPAGSVATATQAIATAGVIKINSGFRGAWWASCNNSPGSLASASQGGSYAISWQASYANGQYAKPFADFVSQPTSCPAGSPYAGQSCIFCLHTFQPVVYSCPAGYTLSGTTCYPPMVTPPPIAATIASYSCPAGSVLSGSTCIPTTTITQTYTCGVGSTLVGTTCTFQPLAVPTYTDGCTTLQAKTL